MAKLSLRPNRASRERTRTAPPSSSNTGPSSQIGGLGKLLRSRLAQLGIIAAIGGAGYAVVSSQPASVSNNTSGSEPLPQPSPEQTLSTYQPSPEEDVALTDRIIQRTSEGSHHLKQILAPKLSGIDQELAQKLYETFQLMDINAKNPNNNLARIQMDMKNGRGEFSNANINYFMFHALPPALALRLGTAANYNAANRTVEVSPEFDPFNLLDIIIFHHELRHVMQDTALRSSLSTREDFDRYMAFFTLHSENDPQKVLVAHEASAYMYEIETLNVLLDGELKMSILNGNPLSPEYIQGKLHAREKQIGTIQLLVSFATSYYTSGSTYRGLTPSFLDTIVATYRRQSGKFDFYETGDFRNPKKWSR